MSDDLAKQLRTDAEAYRQSLAAPTSHDMFTLAYQWQDKKHRHVWDLCDRLETAADRIEKLEAANLKQSCIKVDDQMRIEKLEAALRVISEDANVEFTNHVERGDGWRALAIGKMLLARKALEGKDD